MDSMTQSLAVPALIPLPAPAQVEPGIWSLPVPLPGSSLRYVVPYALEVPGGLVLIDAGWDADEPWNALVAGLGTMGASPHDVRGVLVTHAHPDHYGLAPRLREISGAWVALHPADRHMLAADRAEADQSFGDSLRWLIRMGATPAETESWMQAEALVIDVMLAGLPDRELVHGERVADLPGFDLTTLHTPGHTDGHVCFLDRERDLFFSGDHVLAKISPNVSTMTSLLSNPLGAYLKSLRATGEVDIDRGLAAHVETIPKLRERVAELLLHHEQRLAEMLQTLTTEPGLTTLAVASRQPWKRGWDGLAGQMRRAAIGETHAHLLELLARGAVAQRMDGPVIRWEAVDGGMLDGQR